ncbi:YcxB family protein [uncultured Mucilaginibacter sp.]|uniref:YcxB family protein n=1 Tax=uncultured Mucilaginibacter sp. TaxID=797541 RepID=UPI0025D5A5CC|nr:YcxB family protein [uncultured Mucilaginibacter sp.]
MQIEYQLSKKDYLESSKLYLKSVLQQRSWVFILLTIILIGTLNGETFLWWRFLIAIVVSPLVIIMIVYFIPLLIVLIRLNNANAKNKSTFESKKVTVNDEGLLVESESKTQMRKWGSIASAWSNDKFIYLILADKKFSPVPKNAFPSETEAINFLRIVQSKIIQQRGKLNFQLNTSKTKPPYLLGLICIVPLVGAFVGFGLLMYGIFQYKDKWLIIIGAAGIVWTVAVYGSMDYQLKNSLQTRKGFAEISQMQLNSLLKNIEFYKIQHVNYPDSLAQVTEDDKMVAINDPLRSFDKDIKKDTKYIYQRVGNHYYPFSSGIDGIPNTKDDIYPQVAKSDSAKLGLIRKSH